MRFYKLTYKAKDCIESKTKETGERFESLFSAMPDEISESSEENAKAFIYTYSNKKVRFALSVKTGSADDYIDEINSYLPSNIIKKAVIREITSDEFNDMIRKAERINNFDDDDIREEIGIDKIYKRYGTQGNYTEDFIESYLNEYISEDLDEERTRIRESGEPHLEYIPVHYIIGGNSSGSRENMMNVLLSELKKYNRIFQNRYSVLHIYDTRCDINKIADELSGFFEIGHGGTIVFSIEEKIQIHNDRCSFVQDMLKELCKKIRKYEKDTLCVFVLPDNFDSSFSEIHKLLPETVFVDIKEGKLNCERSKKYLSKAAKSNNVCSDKELYGKIEKDSNYFKDELDFIFNEWYKKVVVL